MVQSGELPPRTAIPLAFLYTQNRSAIEGATRFQKLVFLGQEESELPREYEYEPDNYGPFSPQLRADMRLLADGGYIEKEVTINSVGNPVHMLRLTQKGIRAAREFADRDTTGRIFDSASEIKREWGEEQIGRLLRYVYNSYEEYATESELDLDRLFDTDSRSQFLEPADDEPTIESVDDADIEYNSYIRNATVIPNPDDVWTARDEDLNLTAQGDTREEALENLGEIIATLEGDAGHRTTDEELEDLGLDPSDARDPDENEVPEYMQ